MIDIYDMRTLASASVLRSSMPSTVKCLMISTDPFHGRSTTTLAKYWTRPYGWSSNDAGRYIGSRTLNGQLYWPGDSVSPGGNRQAESLQLETVPIDMRTH